MQHASYVVFGRYSHERSSHQISKHRSRAAAWRAARKAHYALGGCEGGNMLASVFRALTAEELTSVQADIMLGLYQQHAARRAGLDSVDDIDGHLYTRDDYWAAHQIVWTGSGFAAVVK